MSVVWVEISPVTRLPLEIEVSVGEAGWQWLQAGVEIATREVLVDGEPSDGVAVRLRRVNEGSEIHPPAPPCGPSLAASTNELEEGKVQVELQARPDRFKDRDLAVVDEWVSGCIICGEEEVAESLPGSEGILTLPLCPRHVRWALASRREGMGKQSRRLRGLLLAWCRLHGDDRETAKAWLAKGARGRHVG